MLAWSQALGWCWGSGPASPLHTLHHTLLQKELNLCYLQSPLHLSTLQRGIYLVTSWSRSQWAWLRTEGIPEPSSSVLHLRGERRLPASTPAHPSQAPSSRLLWALLLSSSGLAVIHPPVPSLCPWQVVPLCLSCGHTGCQMVTLAKKWKQPSTHHQTNS